MKCTYLRIKSKDYKKYLYCNNTNIKKEINFNNCRNCKYKEYKVVKKAKTKSSKLKNLESKRYSILQIDNSRCFNCNRHFNKLDKHEAFGGSNRTKSMEWGLVYYLCRECHSKADIDSNFRQYLHDYAREHFIEKYSKEKFLKEFGKMYIDKNTI